MTQTMLRRFVQVGAILALLTGTAAAQIPLSFPTHDDKPPPTAEEIEKQKALDNAYRSATGKIPEKHVADPWGDIRTPSGTDTKHKHDHD